MKYFLLVVVFALSACDSGSQSSMNVQVPENIRTAQAVNSPAVSLRVIIENANPIDFAYNNQSPFSISLPNVNVGVDNQYSMVWYEMVEGVELLLSTQEGTFFADPESRTATASGNHIIDIHDSDHDGIPNITERIAGNCPWVACNSTGGLLSPNAISELTSFPDANFTMVRTSGETWTETAASGNHFWVETETTDTLMSFADAEREVLLQIDLSAGEVNFSYNTPGNDEYFLIYLLRSGF